MVKDDNAAENHPNAKKTGPASTGYVQEEEASTLQQGEDQIASFVEVHDNIKLEVEDGGSIDDPLGGKETSGRGEGGSNLPRRKGVPRSSGREWPAVITFNLGSSSQVLDGERFGMSKLSEFDPPLTYRNQVPPAALDQAARLRRHPQNVKFNDGSVGTSDYCVFAKVELGLSEDKVRELALNGLNERFHRYMDDGWTVCQAYEDMVKNQHWRRKVEASLQYREDGKAFLVSGAKKMVDTAEARPAKKIVPSSKFVKPKNTCMEKATATKSSKLAMLQELVKPALNVSEQALKGIQDNQDSLDQVLEMLQDDNSTFKTLVMEQIDSIQEGLDHLTQSRDVSRKEQLLLELTLPFDSDEDMEKWFGFERDNKASYDAYFERRNALRNYLDMKISAGSMTSTQLGVALREALFTRSWRIAHNWGSNSDHVSKERGILFAPPVMIKFFDAYLADRVMSKMPADFSIRSFMTKWRRSFQTVRDEAARNQRRRKGTKTRKVEESTNAEEEEDEDNEIEEEDEEEPASKSARTEI